MFSLFPFLTTGDGVLKKYVGFGKNIVIPDKVKRIAKWTFMGNRSIENIYVPDGVKLDESAFQGCQSLQSIRLPNDLEELKNSLFLDCHSLQKITVPSSVRKIDGCVFQSCYALSEITILGKTDTINSFCFASCRSLEKLELPDGIVNICYKAFANCTKLKHITIPEGVVSIKEKAFTGCTSLETVTLPQTLQFIGHDAFNGCTALKNINLHENIQTIQTNAFLNCPHITVPPKFLTTVSSDNAPLPSKPKIKTEKGEVSSCSGNIVDLVIPDGVTAIWSGALSSETQKTLKTVIIPEGVEYIRANTFQDCPNLVSVKLPASVRSILTKAFANCVNLREINFPKNIKEVSPDAFDNCPHIKLPEWIDSQCCVTKQNGSEVKLMVVNGEVCRCEGKFVDLVIPEGVTAIWSAALSSETQKTLKTVIIPEGIDCIRANTFQDCPHLVSVKLPASVRSILTKAFANCVNLRKINFPENIQLIEEEAFVNCPKVTIPETIQKKMDSGVGGMAASFRHIPDNTVYRDNILIQGGYDTPKNLVVRDGVTAIGRGAFAFFGLKSAVLPDGLTSIGNGAFTLCDEMESIHLPDTLVYIGEKAFSCCGSLTQINFPDSIQYISPDAFEKCKKLHLPRHIVQLMNNSYFKTDNLQDKVPADKK